MSSGLSFIEGFFLGQLSVILVLGAFIKFFIFGEAPSPQSRGSIKQPKHIRTSSLHNFANATPTQSLRKKPSANNVLRPVPQHATDIESILRKTYYQIALRGAKNKHTTHQPESLDWFNVLLAQTIAQYRQTAYNLKDLSPDRPSVLTSLSKAINDPTKRPSFIDEIKITEISLGEEFPIFSNVRVIAADDEPASAAGGRLQALMDVDLSDDNITLGIETNLILNYPKPFSAILPVALTVSVVRFSGTLSISFVPATDHTGSDAESSQPPSSKPKTNLAFSFLPDYRLDLSVKSLIGSRSRLQDVPKIAQLVEARIQSWFEERVVEPRVQVVPLPGLWPRLGKTRVREGQEDDGRPMSQEGSAGSKGSFGMGAQTTPRKTNDGFPSQEEAEALMQGLRRRPGGLGRRQSSDVFIADDEDDRRIDSRPMPGALPI